MSLPARRAFSLIELVVVIVVVGLAAPPLTALVCEVLKGNARSSQQATAAMLASGLMEEILSSAFEDPALPTGSFGTEEAARDLYDDADDYNGLDNKPPCDCRGNVLSQYSGFRIRAAVQNVAEANLNGPAVANGSSEYKRVTVTVDCDGGGGTARLVGLITKSAPSLSGLTYLSRRVNHVDDLEFQLKNNTATDIYLTHLKLGWPSPTAYYEKVKIMPEGKSKWFELWTMKKMGDRRMYSGGVAMFSGRTALVPAGKTAWIKVEKFKDQREGSASNVNVRAATFVAEFWAAPYRYNPLSIPAIP